MDPRIVTCPDCGAEATFMWREGGQEEASPDGQGLRSSEGYWYLSAGGCDCAAHDAALREDQERLEDARRSAAASAALTAHEAAGQAARTDDPRWVSDGEDSEGSSRWITVASLAIAALNAGQPKPRCTPTGVQEMGVRLRPWHPRSVGVPAPTGAETFADLKYRSGWMVAARVAIGIDFM